ncbi:uncharacterized protein LOC131008104 [Salvia miltiorrhiza]|uniref:uncharacterized protein LOC131008104 n=1 Tax=Salvia miltiorrhiza TaxID=226208 RepID=UPI0025AB737A|nr:uncharacterized protein LOC131008104 [Salvia miltiorrhiza]
MARFEGLAALHQYGDGIKCRIFAMTLSGMAQRWFHNLRSNSIQTYGDLHLMFMRQFASAKRVGKTPISLMDIRQEPQETLREYVARFNTIALDIAEVESQIKWYAFARGLKQGPLFEALQIKPPTSFEDIMTITPGYLQLEDAKMARKAEADKLKPKKQDSADTGEKYIARNPYRGLPPRIPTMAVEAENGSYHIGSFEQLKVAKF